MEVIGGVADGREIVISLEQIGPGLKEGDACIIEELEDGSVCCMPVPREGPEVATAGLSMGSTASANSLAGEREIVQRLREAALPLSIVAATVAMAALFAHYAPAPSAQETRERCERLVSGSIELGDRPGAERWLATCDVPMEDAEGLLNSKWMERWGVENPPSMVQGVTEKR